MECCAKNDFRVQLVSVPPKSSGARPTSAPTPPDPTKWLSLRAHLEPIEAPAPAERGTATPTLSGYRLELSGALLPTETETKTGSNEETHSTQSVVLDGETLHVFDMVCVFVCLLSVSNLMIDIFVRSSSYTVLLKREVCLFLSESLHNTNQCEYCVKGGSHGGGAARPLAGR